MCEYIILWIQFLKCFAMKQSRKETLHLWFDLNPFSRSRQSYTYCIGNIVHLCIQWTSWSIITWCLCDTYAQVRYYQLWKQLSNYRVFSNMNIKIHYDLTQHKTNQYSAKIMAIK